MFNKFIWIIFSIILSFFGLKVLYDTGYYNGRLHGLSENSKIVEQTVISMQNKLDKVGENYENTLYGNDLYDTSNDNRLWVKSITTESTSNEKCYYPLRNNDKTNISGQELEYIRQSIKQARQQIISLQETINILTKPEVLK